MILLQIAGVTALVIIALNAALLGYMYSKYRRHSR
jgi:hypothetical protein